MIKFLRELFRHYFVPHHTNNYRAKALHHPSLIAYIILLLFIQSFYIFAKKFNPNVLGYATDITIEKILLLVNQEREKQKLEPLTLSQDLNTAAENKSVDMFDKNYWAHISPTGTTPWEFITKTGYQYIYAGENLAKSFDNSEELVSAWMKSPTHRANILKPEYNEIGLSVKNGVLNGEETTLVVQEFGSRVKPVAVSGSENIKPQFAETPYSADLIADTKTASFPLLRINRTLSLVIAEFLLVVLLIDGLFIWKNKTVRIQGHSLAHVMFLLALLGAMGATGIGAIL